MSKFAYKAEGELNSQYLLDLLKDYLSKLLEANDTNGIVENDYKINPKANGFVQWFKDVTKRMFKSEASLDNYNKVLSTKYINNIVEKIDIFLETNVLQPKQIFELKQTLQAINFGVVLPLIDENRERAIKVAQKRLLKIVNDIKYLKHANTNYILYNSPVEELKPFLSDKVSTHRVNYIEIQKLVKQFVDIQYNELNSFDFEHYDPTFKAKREDFYNISITDNGIGEEVESFIRSKMLEKLEISKHEEVLIEDINYQIEQINILLKKLKLNKIEKMLQDLITLQTNVAHVKEVMDSCKDIINSSTIPNKAQIFLVMDNLYYKLSKKCETLQQKVKLKLQLVDKQKMFMLLETLQVETIKEVPDIKTNQHKSQLSEETNQEQSKKPHIASNLYDDDETNEIHITEDDGESQAEDEIVIDEE